MFRNLLLKIHKILNLNVKIIHKKNLRVDPDILFSLISFRQKEHFMWHVYEDRKYSMNSHIKASTFVFYIGHKKMFFYPETNVRA
jgi:hypothetical protein